MCLATPPVVWYKPMVEKKAEARIPRKVLISERSRLQREKPDLRRIEVAVPAPPTLRDMIRHAIAETLTARSLETGHETFNESDDFDVDDELDDLDWSSRYEFRELRPEPHAPNYNIDGDDSLPLTEAEQRIASKTSETERSEESRKGQIIESE